MGVTPKTAEAQSMTAESIRALLFQYPKGSIGSFISRTGEEFKLTSENPGLKRDPAKRCFENAARRSQAFFGPYGYAEGYVCPPGLIPIHHAWNFDLASGKVIDTTLGWVPETIYLGVRIATDDLRRHVYRTGAFGALTQADGWTPSTFVTG